MSSIRTRLLLALLTLVVSVSLLAGVLTYRRVLAATSTLFDYHLREMALSLRSQVSLAPRIELPPDQGDTDFVIQIWDLFGARIYLSRPGLPLIDRTVLGFADLDVGGERWRSYGLQTTDGVIEIAQPVRVREVLARAAALQVVVPVLLLVPVLGAAIVVVVGRGLSPLRRVAVEVKRRGANSLEPIGATRLPQEVAPLVGELNRLLGRLDAAFAAQCAFVADAAHELRSPLTAVSLQLQLLDRASGERDRLAARAQLGAAVERAIYLVEQLLTLARNEPRVAREKFAPTALEGPAAEAVADSQDLAVSRHVVFRVVTDPNAIVLGNRQALRTLVRNLVDNAVRYTPEGGHVQVKCERTASGSQLQVTDDGPGIPAVDRARAFDRFYRRARSADGGSGLGLAIVKAIAEHHGATVVLNDAPGGGLQVSVAFPQPS